MSEAGGPGGIDVRAPRFVAGITAGLLAVAFVLALLGADAVGSPARFFDPGFLLTAIIALLFLWGVLSPATAPWGVVFRRLVAPRISPVREREDPRPPRFAQGVGFFVTGAGLLLHVAGVPWALPIAVAMAFVAAFLNAVFGLCLGCQLYLLLQRGGLIGRRRPA
ncbi:DUF4395 domain-containing protein [Microbacterium sp. ET2]|uniref:DUF4395 domain-containing protein n=1 Tax=Microbacterium albipurpureum TaxID=3050384 RepID=UPI00259CE695|nr:DUF4395 domain-containing protein [Microbacterium sp. ET2 (Ac-2212)]WJL95281.1 DUF4395 domain-containing protein [Microbacterium sp. ET2 (Ac-2212)]